MRKGYSGARVTVLGDSVLKSGPGTHTQAVLCSMLWPVTPKLLSVDANGYLMEKLSEPTKIDTESVLDMLRTANRLLRNFVWCQSMAASSEWQASLTRMLASFFRSDSLEIKRMIKYLYHSGEPYEAIHGDPTLSNMLYRDDGQLVITDPIWSNKTAADQAVDIGKMLQSAIGWESVTLGWEYDRLQAIKTVLFDETELARMRAWFWCMVHCVRLTPYAAERKDPEAHAWGRKQAEVIFNALKKGYVVEESLCTTLLT